MGKAINRSAIPIKLHRFEPQHSQLANTCSYKQKSTPARLRQQTTAQATATKNGRGRQHPSCSLCCASQNLLGRASVSDTFGRGSLLYRLRHTCALDLDQSVTSALALLDLDHLVASLIGHVLPGLATIYGIANQAGCNRIHWAEITRWWTAGSRCPCQTGRTRCR